MNHFMFNVEIPVFFQLFKSIFKNRTFYSLNGAKCICDSSLKAFV